MALPASAILLETNADGRLHVRLHSLQLPVSLGVSPSNRNPDPVTRSVASAEAS